VARSFPAFRLVTAAFSPLSSQVVRAIHVGFLLLMPCPPPWDEHAACKPWACAGWVLGLTGFVFSLYHWVFEADLTQRAGELTHADWVIGVITVAGVRSGASHHGLGLPVICGIFLPTACLASTCPVPWPIAALVWTRWSSALGFGTEGIYGTPTYVSSTYIFLFILFGAFSSRPA
jgi:TRAP-type uncharacterized transport system fused permease subunit